MYGTSLALVLQAILDGDDLTGLETGRLADLDAAQRLLTSIDADPPEPVPGHPVNEPDPNARLNEVRAAKEAAIDQQHFELAARLRDRLSRLGWDVHFGVWLAKKARMSSTRRPGASCAA